MQSFQITISPSRRAATRFVSKVRRSLQKALLEEERRTGLKQTDIARAIGVHRSVINRELRGTKDITLGRIAELAWAMGRKPVFELVEHSVQSGSNAKIDSAPISVASATTQGTVFMDSNQISHSPRAA
jgi:hypothetical protein